MFETPVVAIVVLPVDFAVPVVALVALLADLAARMASLSLPSKSALFASWSVSPETCCSHDNVKGPGKPRCRIVARGSVIPRILAKRKLLP